MDERPKIRAPHHPRHQHEGHRRQAVQGDQTVLQRGNIDQVETRSIKIWLKHLNH